MRQAAQNVTDALNNLLKKVREGSNIKSGGQYDSACDDILNATDRLFNSMGNASEMVKQAKILAQVGLKKALFLQSMKGQSLKDIALQLSARTPDTFLQRTPLIHSNNGHQ